MLDFGVNDRKTQELRQRMDAMDIQERDLEEQFVRSSGPGGQKVNKVGTCVVLRHRPSNLIVKMQKSRSQGLNRFYARRRLCELLEANRLGSQSPEAIKAQKVRKQKDRRRRRKG